MPEYPLQLFQSVSTLIFLVFLLAKTRVMKSIMAKQEATGSDQLFLSLLFGGISIIGMYNGHPLSDTLANTRPVGIIVGGFIGGPVAGIGAGVVAGIHRLLLGGMSIYDTVLSMLVSGAFAGAFRRWVWDSQRGWLYALLIGMGLECVHMGLLLLLPSKFDMDFSNWLELGAPMILINSIGISAFVSILGGLRSQQDRAEGLAAKLALRIANQTLSFLRKGLSPDSAAKTVLIIHNEVAALGAVAITSRVRVLAFEGLARAHHHPESSNSILTDSTKRVIETGEYLVAEKKSDIGCPYSNCPLASKVVVPLIDHEKVIGTLMLYKALENDISQFEIELAIGLGRLISTQLEVSAGEQQAELRARAEIKALQAQINPHFLFNAVNTIVYYCRKQPETARELLLHLAHYYRNNIVGTEEADLQTEVSHVDSYVKIEMARFHGKLQVLYDIAPECNCKMPSLTLQPIVENAIKHGIYPKKQGGTVKLIARKAIDRILLTVADDGVGMDVSALTRMIGYDPRKAIGLVNVDRRLRSLYGDEFGLRVDSERGAGTEINFAIPRKGVENYADRPDC